MSVTFSGSNHNVKRTITFSDGRSFEVAESVHLTDDPEGDFDDPRWLNICQGNACAFLSLLGWAPDGAEDMYGEKPLAEVRRAIMVARATFDRRVQGLVREEEVVYGKPRDNGDGTVTLKPLRVYGAALGTDQLARYLDRLAVLTEALAAKGATHITWG
jgi:hypothetical protein